MICYRIHFDPEGAKWVIQLQEYHLWGLIARGWKNVVEAVKGDPDLQPVAFPSFDAAQAYAKEIGLDKAYRQIGNRPWDRVVAGNV